LPLYIINHKNFQLSTFNPKMSLINYFEDGITESKNDLFISEIDICNNDYTPLKEFKEDFKDDKSSKEGITSIIKNQFIKEMTDKNIISDSINFNDDYSVVPKNFELFKNLENIQSFSDGEKYFDDNQNYISDNENKDKKHKCSFNLNSKLTFSLSSDDINYNYYINDILEEEKISNNLNKKKIFKIVKIKKNKKQKLEDYLKKKRSKRRKYNRKGDDEIDWDNMSVPKEKHFHLDRKKKRIVFQRKYLKMIYSIVDLEYPFDFIELFNLIKQHVGDKTADNYGNKKSFHIIKIKNKLEIVTMKEKKLLLKGSKISK